MNKQFPAALAFIATLGFGVYLVMHDHVTLGGWICIISILIPWGFENDK